MPFVDIGTSSQPRHRTAFRKPSSSVQSNNTPQSTSYTKQTMLPQNRYQKLDKGKGPATGRLKNFGWKKFALGAAIFIGVVWLFGPRERREQVLGKIKSPSWSSSIEDEADYELPPPQPSQPTIPINDYEPEDDWDSPLPTTTPTLPISPHSPDDDPNPLKTVHCLKSYKDNTPIVQYAIMIDAGSTGSRVHIYKFNNCGASPSYEYEVFLQTKPGLSSYAADPIGAAQSLDVLLDNAVKTVPQSLQSCTPIAVKATAGLRLLGAAQSIDILNAVRQRLQDEYPFPVVEEDGVVIMDGKDEGVYAWITANYLLNTIRADSPPIKAPYAVLDLGGASTQIVFEPSYEEASSDSTLLDGEHKYELQFGGRRHILYQHSYLGYGLMQARASVHRLVEFMSTFNSPAERTDSDVIANPCLARNTQRLVSIEADKSKPQRNITMVGKDVGSFEGCNRIIELVMAKDAICEVKPCSFGGVYQPSLLDTFPTGKILLLSYFYDRIAPFFPDSERPALSVSTFSSLAQDVCLGRSVWTSRWPSNQNLLEELEDRPEWCLDLTFMHGLLRLGYEFDKEREVSIEKQLDGTELGWCLGAAIAIVGGELTCKD